jgi:predicted phosphodiesterase
MRSRRYAILGDIHSNWEAFSAVLKDAEEQEVNQFVCVGDIVGYNSSPAECLEKVRELDCVTVRGNHDHYCSHNDESLEDFHPLAAAVVDWTRSQLSKEQVTYLRDLRLSRMVGGFSVVHSTLDMPEKWGYVLDTLDADAHFNYQTTSVCFYGHTHIPVIYEKGPRVVRHLQPKFKVKLGMRYFINGGSVGQPRDGDPRASYVIYDVGAKQVEFRRVVYDVAAAQRKIRAVGLPDRLAKRLELGK